MLLRPLAAVFVNDERHFGARRNACADHTLVGLRHLVRFQGAVAQVADGELLWIDRITLAVSTTPVASNRTFMQRSLPAVIEVTRVLIDEL